jgi:hypothetical protein
LRLDDDAPYLLASLERDRYAPYEGELGSLAAFTASAMPE